MKKYPTKYLTLFLIVMLSTVTSVLALAELMGPLGKTMHGLMSDLKCLESPAMARFICANRTADALASDLLAHAKDLDEHPEWVTAIVPGADPAAVQSAAKELISHIDELQKAIATDNAEAKAKAIMAIKATEKAAHERFERP